MQHLTSQVHDLHMPPRRGTAFDHLVIACRKALVESQCSRRPTFINLIARLLCVCLSTVLTCHAGLSSSSYHISECLSRVPYPHATFIIVGKHTHRSGDSDVMNPGKTFPLISVYRQQHGCTSPDLSDSWPAKCKDTACPVSLHTRAQYSAARSFV